MLPYSYELFSFLAPHPKSSRDRHRGYDAKFTSLFVVAFLIPLLVLGCAGGETAPTSMPPSGFDMVWVYEPPYTGEFRAQDLEIAATFQLTQSDEIIYRFSDVSMKGELAVSAYPAVIDGVLEAACGLWLLSPETGQVQEISKGILSYPWGAMFSPDGDRIIYAAAEECPSESAQSHEEGMWLLDLRTMETTTLYESEAPVLRGWTLPDTFLAMRHVPDVGWTYRIITLDRSSERVVPDLALEYQGFYLFTDRPSPQRQQAATCGRGPHLILQLGALPGLADNRRADRRPVAGMAASLTLATPLGRPTTVLCSISWPAAFKMVCPST